MIVGRLVLLSALTVAACGFYERLTAPAAPLGGSMPTVGEVPEGLLRELVKKAGLIVLGTPVARESEAGLFTPVFQLGAKETWYSVKLVVDSVAWGKLGQAKHVDLGFMPALLDNGLRFGRLAPNEIVVQYPEVESAKSDWAAAPALLIDERAVFLFRKCYYCVELKGRPSRIGPYYKANPWVAMAWGSKLPPEEWPRVVRIVEELRRKTPPPS